MYNISIYIEILDISIQHDLITDPHLTSTSHDRHIARYSHLARESPSLGYPVAIRASKFLGLRLQLLTSENFNCNDSSTIFHQKTLIASG